MRPSRLLVSITAVWVAGALPAMFTATALIMWAGAGLVMMAIAVVDAVRGRQLLARAEIAVERRQSESVMERRSTPVELRLQWTATRHPFRLVITEQLSESIESVPFPLEVRRSEWNRTRRTLSYRITAHARGSWTIPGFRMEALSPLRLWFQSRLVDAPIRIRCYPQLAMSGAAEQMVAITEFSGEITTRRRGEGTEFQELRDYVPGDPVRSVDWRATSRRLNPVVRVFQEEQDQHVVLLVDGGYRLHQMDAGRLQFDYALEAAMRLAGVALGFQDSVGMLLFGREERWIAPRKGHDALAALMEGAIAFSSEPTPTAPSVALRSCLTRLRRRAFLVLLTNLREEDSGQLAPVFALAAKRHLLLTISLREQGTEPPGSVRSFDDALRFAAAVNYHAQREASRRAWESQGVLTLDAKPTELSGRLIQRYIGLKRSGTL